MATFYNPGFTFREMKQYDNPLTDSVTHNNISYLDLKAPEKSFFEVADHATVTDEAGEEHQVPLKLAKLIKEWYAERGVVLVNPNAKNIQEDDNVALTKEEAKAKGQRLWNKFLRSKANEYFARVSETKAAGQLPVPAQGLFKRVLEELGMKDPADTVEQIIQTQSNTVDNTELMRQVAALTAQLNRLEGAQSKKAGS